MRACGGGGGLGFCKGPGANPNEVGQIEKEEEEVVVVEDFIWNPKGLRRMITRWNQTGWPLKHDSTVLLWHPPYDTPPP